MGSALLRMFSSMLRLVGKPSVTSPPVLYKVGSARFCVFSSILGVVGKLSVTSGRFETGLYFVFLRISTFG